MARQPCKEAAAPLHAIGGKTGLIPVFFFLFLRAFVQKSYEGHAGENAPSKSDSRHKDAGLAHGKNKGGHWQKNDRAGNKPYTAVVLCKTEHFTISGYGAEADFAAG